MKIGVLKEIKDNEKRVAITPNVVSKIKKLGYEVLIENNLGSESNFYDDQYIDNGAEVTTKDEVYKCVTCLYTLCKQMYKDNPIPEKYLSDIELLKQTKYMKVKFKLMDIIERR